MGEVMSTRLVGSGRVEAVLGDLTAEETDAIVNAANSRLAHGGGIAGAIVRRGGAEIQSESDRLAPVAVGKAVVTGAGRLAARWVIHAVGPRWGEGDEEDKLRSAVRNALQRAEERGCASIAVPAISTGIFGYPKAAGCRLICEEVIAHLAAPGVGLRLVRLVAFDRETVDSFVAGLADRC